MPMGQTVPTTANALVLNLEENAQTGNRLQTGSFVTGIVQGATKEKPPRSIVIIGSGVGKASPRRRPGQPVGCERVGGDYVVVEGVGRRGFSFVGDAPWSTTRPAHRRCWRLPANCRSTRSGILLSIGAETLVTVDVTEACP